MVLAAVLYPKLSEKYSMDSTSDNKISDAVIQADIIFQIIIHRKTVAVIRYKLFDAAFVITLSVGKIYHEKHIMRCIKMKNKVWLIVACVFAAVMVLAAVLYPKLSANHNTQENCSRYQIQIV